MGGTFPAAPLYLNVSTAEERKRVCHRVLVASLTVHERFCNVQQKNTPDGFGKLASNETRNLYCDAGEQN